MGVGVGEGEGEVKAHHVQLTILSLTANDHYDQGTMAMRAGRFDLAMPNVAKAYELFMREHHLLDESQRNGMLQALIAVKDKFGEFGRGETWWGQGSITHHQPNHVVTDNPSPISQRSRGGRKVQQV